MATETLLLGIWLGNKRINSKRAGVRFPAFFSFFVGQVYSTPPKIFLISASLITLINISYTILTTLTALLPVLVETLSNLTFVPLFSVGMSEC